MIYPKTASNKNDAKITAFYNKLVKMTLDEHLANTMDDINA